MSVISDELMYMLETVGEEKFDELMKYYSGTNVYFPMYKNYKKDERDQKIVKLFNGSNKKDLARMFGISYQQVANIIKASMQKNYKNNNKIK